MNLRAAPLTLLLGGPILAGIGFTTAQGAGHLTELFAWPGLLRACLLSLGPGLVATGCSVLLVMLLLALRPLGFGLLQRVLAPVLALPHAAAALGLAFLIAPSGWIARMISPWLTGWQAPPDLMVLNDPMGAALTLGLVIKEAPFLLILALPALTRGLERQRIVASTLGYGRAMGFALVVWPLLYRQIRLPVLAVLAYAMTNVDMALILGPGLPHTLAVQISLWMSEPNLTHQGEAAAGALVQLALVMGGIASWRGMEALGASAMTQLRRAGVRGRRLDPVLLPFAAVYGLVLAMTPVLGIAALALWSIAGLWPFPAVVPQQVSLAVWTRAAGDLGAASATTVGLAITVTLAALILCLATLSCERAPSRFAALIYVPLILPQIAFLPGIASALIRVPVPPLLAVALAHLVFVTPYIFLTLAGPFRAWDARVAAVGASLGASPARVFFALRLPMLAPALAAAVAVGVAVSVGQYLPTLLIGGGRINTLTTEAVALASGSNRRIVGAYGLMQAFWPALAFGLAARFRRA